jgi:predicted Rossmann fold flavoprotein
MSRIAIIGAGAAGCFAAANMPPGHELHVFEKSARPLQKVKVSGGGRCNVTHACFEVDELLQRYPRGAPLLKRTLHRFGPQQTIDWFQQRGVMLKTEPDGRMFPVTDSSQTVIDCLLAAMNRSGAKLHFGRAVSDVLQQDTGWLLHFSDGSFWEADIVLLACGGIQKPEQWAWLSRLGHHIETPAPSLFTFNLPGHPVTQLMGVSVPDASLRLAGIKGSFTGPILITHWGLSGPAVLRASAWAARALQERRYECDVIVNWLKEATEADLRAQFVELRRAQGKYLLTGKNPFGLPRRLWEFLLQRSGVDAETRWGELPAAQQQRLIRSLIADVYPMKGKTTFKEEFVTCGGISLKEIDPHTMESRLAQGLFFAGEAMDVDGITGGFNFQHAWSSGWLAAQALAK